MAHAGQVLDNPVTGHRYHILQAAADTGGTLLDMEVTYPPGARAPAEHLHPQQQEHFEVLEGALQVRLAGRSRELRRGETLVIPPGTAHAMWNPSAVPARVRWQTRPALQTEQFFEAVVGLAQQGRVDAAGTPRLLDLALLVPAFSEEIRVLRPPYWLQRVVFAILGPIARLRGRDRHLVPVPGEARATPASDRNE